uniref:Uncharacterized protein n=1 Tax=Aegilops tauschii subsp. strangulata TaxID=200361 RepID=A0A453KH44_AEGTS
MLKVKCSGLKTGLLQEELKRRWCFLYCRKIMYYRDVLLLLLVESVLTLIIVPLLLKRMLYIDDQRNKALSQD